MISVLKNVTSSTVSRRGALPEFGEASPRNRDGRGYDDAGLEQRGIGWFVQCRLLILRTRNALGIHVPKSSSVINRFFKPHPSSPESDLCEHIRMLLCNIVVHFKSLFKQVIELNVNCHLCYHVPF